MAGALALGEYLAGAVVALMLAGGNALEAIASRRARARADALARRGAAVAHVRRDGAIEEVAVDAIAVGDVVLVRTGEVVPVDGELVSEHAVVDESALTGEPLPVTRARGEPLRSGSANAGAPFELRATRRAADSAYAGARAARRARPSASARRSCASPTATRRSSCRSRCRRRRRVGGSAAIRSARSRCSSSRRRAR